MIPSTALGLFLKLSDTTVDLTPWFTGACLRSGVTMWPPPIPAGSRHGGTGCGARKKESFLEAHRKQARLPFPLHGMETVEEVVGSIPARSINLLC